MMTPNNINQLYYALRKQYLLRTPNSDIKPILDQLTTLLAFDNCAGVLKLEVRELYLSIIKENHHAVPDEYSLNTQELLDKYQEIQEDNSFSNSPQWLQKRVAKIVSELTNSNAQQYSLM